MQRSKPLVSIVIPTYNRIKLLTRLIDGLLKNNYTNIEIIIIDDASKDNTEEIVHKKYGKNKKIRYFKNKKNMFASAAKNIGAKKAKGKYIFFIDDDNVVTNDLIKKLVDVIEKDTTIAEVGPVMYFFPNKKKIFWAGTNRNMSTSKTNFTTSLEDHKNEKIWETDDILNSYMVRSESIKKNDIQFDARFGIMYEESDFAYKIKKLGYKIKVVKDAKIFHDTPEFSQNSSSFLHHTMLDIRRPYYTARNRLVFHSRYSTPMQLFGIAIFWQWLFSAFYITHIFLYDKPGHFSVNQKIKLAFSYLRGVKDGLRYFFYRDASL